MVNGRHNAGPLPLFHEIGNLLYLQRLTGHFVFRLADLVGQLDNLFADREGLKDLAPVDNRHHRIAIRAAVLAVLPDK